MPAAGRLLDRVAAFAGSRAGLVAVALWAFAEATVFPVIPDVLLGLLVLAAPRRLPRLFAVLLVAALAGSAVLYAATLVAPDAVTAMLLSLPAIDPAVIAAARSQVARGDPASMALFGFGIPLKVDTAAWAMGPGTPAAFAVGVIVNRVTRILPLAVLLAVAGTVAGGWARRHERLVVALYAAGFVLTYAYYWTR